MESNIRKIKTSSEHTLFLTVLAVMTGDQYRSAFECIGDKHEVRQYLQGLHVKVSENGSTGYTADLVATNGHLLLKTPVFAGKDVTEGFAITFRPVKIPANVVTVELCRCQDGGLHIVTVTKAGNFETYGVENIDWRYPDYNAVIPKLEPEKHRGPGYMFGFDAEYLSRLAKIFGKVPLAIRMTSRDKAARVSVLTGGGNYKYKDLPNETLLVLMPVKV